MENYLVSGAAGFIASRVIEMLLDAGHTVVGVDNMNDAYDVRMKEYRLKKLEHHPNFIFHRSDISERAAFADNVTPKATKVRRSHPPGSPGRCTPVR